MNKHTVQTAINFRLNGTMVGPSPATGARLSETLREQLGARDVKIGCNAGDCGACTVLLDGAPVCACMTPTQQAEGRDVETLSGLRTDPVAADLTARFQDHGAAQCGICTPGMMVAAVALLRNNPTPTENEVQDALAGVLCRCTGYRKIIDAVMNRPTTIVDDGAVGDAIRRVDGLDKIAGVEQFSDDVAPPDTLEIFVIRATLPRAAFTLGDLDQFVRDTDGLVAHLSAADITGRNAFGVIPQFVDQPVFAEHETLFRGEAVAAIIGTPQAIKAFDPATFPITWTALPATCNMTAAQSPDADLLHTDRANNVMCGGFVQCGDAQGALARAAVTV